MSWFANPDNQKLAAGLVTAVLVLLAAWFGYLQTRKKGDKGRVTVIGSKSVGAGNDAHVTFNEAPGKDKT